MTQDELKALADSDLLNVIDWAETEQKARTEKRKRETVAKIKALARSIEVGVKIVSTRGASKAS